MTDYYNSTRIMVKKTMSSFNSISNFVATFNNYNGRHNTDFTLNQDVSIFAEQTTGTPTTKVFKGILEDIKFSGDELRETIELSGRDYGAILQDIIVSPRIFKDTEVSEIVNSLMIQNAAGTGITIGNVNVTTTTIDKITFNGVSLFDAIKKLAQFSGFFFYVDVDKDLHFEEENSVSSGILFDSENVTDSSFRESDDDLFNHVKVVGERQLTGAQDIFTTGTDNTGSLYTLSAKPRNTIVTLSGAGATSVQLQPGGIINIDNPSVDDVKFLVDFNNSSVILTSGAGAGDNIQNTGSVVIVDYQRSTPLISIKQDLTSIATYGQKDKEIIDKNIKSLDEANDEANNFITENKDPKIEGIMSVKDLVNVTPGQTATVDIPHFDINSETYNITSAKYIFNKANNLSNQTLTVSVNKKVDDFVDLFKQHELRLRQLETAEVDTSVTNTELFTGSIGLSGTCTVVQKAIGSAFYFNVTGHDILESPQSLLGNVEGGSTVQVL